MLSPPMCSPAGASGQPGPLLVYLQPAPNSWADRAPGELSASPGWLGHRRYFNGEECSDCCCREQNTLWKLVMLRNLASVVGFALIQVFAAFAADFGTAEEAKAMLERAVAAVKEDKAKALDMFNKGEGGF